MVDGEARHPAAPPRRTVFRLENVNVFYGTDREARSGVLVEFGDTAMIFSNPADDRTEHYVTGRFG